MSDIGFHPAEVGSPAPLRRKRLDRWPSLMREVMRLHAKARFKWGKSDCTMWADVVFAIRGEDPLAGLRDYDSEKGALRILKGTGHPTVLSFVEAHFEEIPPSLAQRGDLGYPAVVRHPLMSPAVIDGAYAYSKAPVDGWVSIPRTALARTFAV